MLWALLLICEKVHANFFSSQIDHGRLMTFDGRPSACVTCMSYTHKHYIDGCKCSLRLTDEIMNRILAHTLITTDSKRLSKYCVIK